MARGKKKPSHIKKLEGSYQPYRELGENEMTPETVDKLSHDGLINTFADNIWLKLNRNLAAIGMLNEIDQELLMAYCNEMGIYFHAMDVVKRTGYEQESNANGMIISNFMKIGNTALNNAIKLSDKFGFNPAARTKIEMPTKKKGDIFDDL